MKTHEYKSHLERLVAEGKFKNKNEMLSHILLKVLDFESTEEQKSDRCDFREVSITTIKNVLDAVYLAGQMSVK